MSQNKPPSDREESAISHARPYTVPGVRVFYDRGRCLHFAECVRRCPSGALHYRLEEGPSEEPEQPTRVEFVANGPINLRGDLSIEVPAGRMREVRASLCRCGRTEKEPFCDNACGSIGWASKAPTRDND